MRRRSLLRMALGGTALSLLGGASGVGLRRAEAASRPVLRSHVAADPGHPAGTVRLQGAGGFPYHPLVYHLDLSILTYHLYAQTIVWPFDPYYEDFPNDGNRAEFMQRVRTWANTTGGEQVARQAGADGYRGPGLLNGFPDNPLHDPILYRYDRLYPQSTSVTGQIVPSEAAWIDYLTPTAITERIREVYVCYRRAGQPEGAVELQRIDAATNGAAPNPSDVVLAFEGETGDKGEPGQPGSQSVMGFVLMRPRTDKDAYDVHIAFRGSRSGDAKRAALLALSTDSASGNPDWITDLGTRMIPAGHVSKVGGVRRGFARSMESMYPQVFRCLKEVATLAGGASPDRVFVTGHSLGGALAQHFTSAVLLGDRFGPNGQGAQMPAELRPWPWQQIKLITYGAPRSGDTAWAQTLTTQGLRSDFWDVNDDFFYDDTALQVTDPTIVPRLSDTAQPVGYRVLLPGDVITSRLAGGKHVGKTVYLETPPSIPSTEDHEPAVIRDRMLASLNDPGIPPTAWLYHGMTALNPQRNDAGRGAGEEYQKLQDAVANYYASRGLRFDQAVFRSDGEKFLALLGLAPFGPGGSAIPGLPSVPDLPSLPSLPAGSDLPSLPNLPNVPNLPGLPRP